MKVKLMGKGVCVCGRGGGHKVQTPSYKTNKTWAVMYRVVTTVNNTAVCI